MNLQFLGATGTVTGSKYLLDTGKARILIDAGLFQGLKELRELNWRDLPVPASSIDAIVRCAARLIAATTSPDAPRTGTASS